MSATTFTETQAKHALAVVLGLMRDQRFFPHRNDPRVANNPGWVLSPTIFREALLLDNNLRDVYAAAREDAEAAIERFETSWGIAKPDLSGNKQVVQCNRYTGGLDICRVLPLAAFSEFVPASLDALTEECLTQILHGMAKEDCTPSAFERYRTLALETGEKIWDQFDEMNVRDPENPLCVVIMQTRYDCRGKDSNDDFMESRTRDMQKFPHAMGYLFCKYSLWNRLVGHSHVVFNTSRLSHVNVQHWKSGSEPGIWYDARGGYDCPVVFVAVL
jgi:hypothetical protein